MIGRAGIGVDNVDIPAATARGIIVMNTPFGNSITTAEHAISLMLALARQIPEADASTRAGKWEKNKFLGVEIFGKTLGVVGCGNIGSIVADRAIGLRMKVIAFDPFLSQERAADLGVEKVELDELFRRADFITLHTPLTDKTRNIINVGAIKHMKKGVRIINCARGGLVDEGALYEALKNGKWPVRRSTFLSSSHLEVLGRVDVPVELVVVHVVLAEVGEERGLSGGGRCVTGADHREQGDCGQEPAESPAG